MSTLEPGVYPDLSRENYNALPYANATGLRRLFLSPAAFLAAEAQPETLAMKGGTYVHMAVLERPRFEADVVCMPNFHGGMLDETARDKGYAGGKLAKAAWVNAHEGCEVVEGSVRDEALGISAAFDKCAAARVILTGGQSEVSLVWDDPTGVRCKARLDYLLKNKAGGWTVVDLKKTTSVRPESFEAEVGRLRLHLQAALYLRGLQILHGVEPDPIFGDGYRFAWAAFEGAPPHWCRVYEIGGPDRDAATVELERMLRVVARCQRLGHWPDYSNKVRAIGPPTHYRPYQFPDDYQETD